MSKIPKEMKINMCKKKKRINQSSCFFFFCCCCSEDVQCGPRNNTQDWKASDTVKLKQCYE